MLCLITCNKYKLQHVGKKYQDLNKKFNGLNFCSRNPSSYSFCEILNAHSTVLFLNLISILLNFVPKTQYNLSCIINKPEEAGHAEREMLWILHRNQLQRLEKNIRCINYKHLFHNYWITDDLKLKGIL